jgi:hypothetical protein
MMKLFGTNVSRETFTLAEGRVNIIYPATLSSESLKDLSDYLDIFLRKAQRLSDDPHDLMPPKIEEKKAPTPLQPARETP